MGWVVELGSRPEAEHALAEDWRPAADPKTTLAGLRPLVTQRYVNTRL